ncbi:hypothetical protein J1779_13095 [Rahnella sp. FC061912-K]|uniref:tetratricopeptide repeat protein n=1 Tax=Rahnella rivi TaxID=2816249 RepID=UPI001C262BCF|nr:hypothetical protein [Rahnella rivi]MBU9830873.1 hypothetical protein [Rahnella rivi]
MHNFLNWKNTDKNPLLKYYAAHLNFLFGEYSKTILILKKLNRRYPKHADMAYLLSETYRLEGKNELARDILEETLENSHRLKTWLLLANLTVNNSDHQRLKSLWVLFKNKGKIPGYHYELQSYISTSAMRSKNYGDAIALWKDFIQKTINKEVVFPSNVSKKKFSSGSASKALIDLKKVFKNAGIDFFLVSGTLLGCIRERKLLGHDKDIDVGVWSDVSTENIINQVKKSGLFYIQATRSSLALRIKHVNGTAIDIFLHFREEGNYWHGGSKLKWNNTPFSLITCDFLNDEYLIPADYDLYLTENYGDWRTEKSNFDSAFDTPNATVINNAELIVHTYRQLAKSIHLNESQKIETHIKMLKKHGEEKIYF